MSFGESITTVFRKYVDFSGYATRPEYWWFVLFYTIVYIATNILDAIIGAAMNINGFSLFTTLWALAVLLPGLAVIVRRLRDGGYAWPWIFILFVPLAGAIVLIVLLCQPTKRRVELANPAYATMR